ncbi:hypothetical protein T4B_4621 [Trichinella pseudospiralis]|uniref:Uncharacterized protein n=1 Tax=Trichinella pseudospiralis TaxID=6337 RepID=A0A0V1IEN9_TRIPS|nr:hypothetical protein T4E_1242 [Trichinella pseudospiralis]KRY71550.1 hypothetical protein T4A_1323 [Trichinella pseudospiralis]KRZ21042.1 hypothetical protein T4B_4621 [Trichinella pseudospiralis]
MKEQKDDGGYATSGQRLCALDDVAECSAKAKEIHTQGIILLQHSRGILRNEDDLGRTSLVTHCIETDGLARKAAFGHMYETGDQVWLQAPVKEKLGAHWDGLRSRLAG